MHDDNTAGGSTAEEINPSSASSASAEASNDESLRQRVQVVIDEQINPAVAMHGGFVSLVDVRDSKVYVNMGGGCQGCGMAAMTLAAGIEALLLEEIPEISAVVDATNHADGDSPYYSSPKL